MQNSWLHNTTLLNNGTVYQNSFQESQYNKLIFLKSVYFSGIVNLQLCLSTAFILWTIVNMAEAIDTLTLFPLCWQFCLLIIGNQILGQIFAMTAIFHLNIKRKSFRVGAVLWLNIEWLKRLSCSSARVIWSLSYPSGHLLTPKGGW